MSSVCLCSRCLESLKMVGRDNGTSPADRFMEFIESLGISWYTSPLVPPGELQFKDHRGYVLGRIVNIKR